MLLPCAFEQVTLSSKGDVVEAEAGGGVATGFLSNIEVRILQEV